MCSQGARSVKDEEKEKEKVREKSTAFRGTGFRLGDTEAPSQQIAGQPKIQKTEKAQPLNMTDMKLSCVCMCVSAGEPHANILVQWFLCGQRSSQDWEYSTGQALPQVCV